MALAPGVLESLCGLDSDWLLIPIDGRKRPVDPGSGEPLGQWASAGCSLEDFTAAAAGSPHVQAVGLVLGPASGVLAVDFDGPGAAACFQRIYGCPPGELPATVGWSSGLPQRAQLAYRVPLEYWDCLRGRRSWGPASTEHTPTPPGPTSGPGGKRRRATVLELRWEGHQSVIAGVHPLTGSYRWLEGRSPAQVQVADAPDWLLEPLFKRPEEPVEADFAPRSDDQERAIELLAHIQPREDYDGWLTVGMALHSIDPGLLTHWIAWSRGCSSFNAEECQAKWRSFKGRGVTIGTLFHFAALDGYAPRQERSRKAVQPSAAPAGPLPALRLLNRQECRQRLEQAIADDLAQADLELLIDELAASSELVPRSLHALLKALQQQAQRAEALQAAAGALLQERERHHQQAITLEQLLPPQLVVALRSLTGHLPYSDTAVAMAWLACVSGLTKLGTAVCGNPITRYVVPTNLYVCTVARSGQKKTPLEQLLVVEPTRDLQRELARDNARAHANWREQCRGCKASERPPLPVPLHLQLQDYTGEALVAQLQALEARGMAVLVRRDELSGLFGSLNAYRQGRGADEQQLLELFDGHSYTSLRITSGQRSFERCHLSIYGGIQPEVLSGLVKGGDPSGKWARFLFSPLPRRTARLPTAITPEQQRAVQDSAETLAALARAVHGLPPALHDLQPAALELFSHYEHSKQEQALAARLGAQAAIHGKAAGKVLRIAGLLQVLQTVCCLLPAAAPLGVDVLQAAIALVESLDGWALGFHELAASSDAEGTELTGLMERLHRIAAGLGGPVSWKDLRGRLAWREKRHLNVITAEQALQALAAAGYGQVDAGPRGGLLYTALQELP
ncbi:MAG: DUF3987 domain-containing protein [Cyanobium sp. M30B3]|nr:MAG: DUF3987 domain-containing protein [Cyanobium sp. M30B3]